MSVILAGISSALLAIWASKKEKKTKKAWDRMEQLRSIPVVPVSGLKTLLPHQDDKKIVFLRGVVLPQTYTTLFSDSTTMIIRSERTGHEALVVEERTILLCDDISKKPTRTERKVASRKRKQVPFVIADHATKPCTEFVIVNLEGLDDHQVPLQKVWSDQKKLFGSVRTEKCSELSVDEVTEEEILPIGSVLSAVGVFTSENGVPTIKPCQQLDYFLTTKSKEELIAELHTQLQLVSDHSNLLYKLSFSLAGYAILTLTFRTVRYLLFD